MNLRMCLSTLQMKMNMENQIENVGGDDGQFLIIHHVMITPRH